MTPLFFFGNKNKSKACEILVLITFASSKGSDEPVHTYSKTCLKWPLKTKNWFTRRLSLNAGQKFCRMLKESILQYFLPSLSHHLSLRPLFCLFLSGRLDRFYCMCRLVLAFAAHIEKDVKRQEIIQRVKQAFS